MCKIITVFASNCKHSETGSPSAFCVLVGNVVYPRKVVPFLNEWLHASLPPLAFPIQFNMRLRDVKKKELISLDVETDSKSFAHGKHAFRGEWEEFNSSTYVYPQCKMFRYAYIYIFKGNKTLKPKYHRVFCTRWKGMARKLLFKS